MIKEFVSQYTDPVYDFIFKNWIYAVIFASLIIIILLVGNLISCIIGSVNEGKVAKKCTFQFITESEIKNLITEEKRFEKGKE